MYSIFGKHIHADALQNPAHALLDSKGLIENGNEQVGTHGDPDLRLHRVLAGAVEGLDPQVLFEPFEKQLDLPTGLVDFRDDDGLDLEVVGEEDQGLSGLGIQIADASKISRVVRLGFRTIEADDLVGPQARGLDHRARRPDIEARVRLCPGHEEGPGRVDAGQPEEIQISTVHHIEGSRFEDDPVQSLHVVDLPLGDRNECGNRTLQVDHGVNLDRRLRSTEPGPRKKVHAQVDHRSVQGVDDLIDLLDVSVLRIQLPSPPHQDLREFEVDTPVPMFVGVGQVASRHQAADAHRVEQLGLRAQARLDIPQALPKSQLGEDHAQELVPGGEGPAASRHRISGYTSLELLPMDQLDDLRKNQSAGVHAGQSQLARSYLASRFKCVTRPLVFNLLLNSLL